MHDRSLPGLAILLLAASCVPPSPTAPLASAGAAPADRAAAPPVPGGPSPALLALDGAGADGGAMPSLPPFVDAARSDEDGRRSLDCLTAAIYYEARSEPLDGQRAVAQVVLNRVRSPAFPNSVCGVVYQGAERTTGCQFTFTCDGSLLYRREPDAWERAREVARAALAGSIYPAIGLATYYHTTAVLPWWAASLDRVALIGSHIFYRWRGALGGLDAFSQQYAGTEPDSDAAAAAASAASAGSLAETIYTVAGVAVHRGGAPAPAGAMPDELVRAVTVHRGTAAPGDIDDATSSSVTVHRAATPGDVGGG